SEYGIKRQLTAAYTPQQNGVSERKNRTLMNVVRSMLNGRNVPKRFWPEAVVWATYVINRSPTLSVKNMTPEQAWRGTKPSVSFFKVFGCIGYVHVPDVKRKKLDAKGIKCVLLGVSEESKAYKLYDPIQKKIIISRDVVFDENQGWNWEDKNKSKITEDYESIDLEVTEPMVGEDEPTSSVNNGNHADEENDHEDHDDNSSTEGEETSLPPRTRKPPGWTRDYVTDLNSQE
ncbi:cysteine-rich receptor-like protein kinase 25-like protein, partial [Trifolium pratense]